MRFVLPFVCGLILTTATPGQQSSSALIAEGQRLYTANCFACHGAGETVQGADIRGGQFRRAANDADLARIITNGIPGTAMPPNNFTPQQMAALIAYLRSPRDQPERSAVSGDTSRGKAIFESRGCLNCHRVGARGSRVGPDLSDIGSQRPAREIEQSILDPNAVVLPQNRYVRATTNAGAVITGRRLNEDTLTVQLIDSKEQLVSLSRSALREYVVRKDSPMPSYKGKLSTRELSDLVSYLSSLRGIMP
jgi:putative heme-binding domain-containing protein